MPDVSDPSLPYSGQDVPAPGRGAHPVPLTREPLQARRPAALAADAELKALDRQSRAASNATARKLAEIEREQLHECFGFTSVWKYAVDRKVARSRTHVNQMLHLVNALPRWPAMRERFEQAAHWTKLREVLREAERRGGELTDHDALLVDADELTSEQIQEKYRVERGDPEPRRRTLPLSDEAEALWDQLLLDLRRDEPDLTESQALALLVRSFRQRGEGGAVGTRIVLHAAVPADVATTPGASKAQVAFETAAAAVAATLQGRDGPVPVSRAAFMEGLCNAEINDVRLGPARIRKAVPPRKQRFVHDRDQGCCKAPGCSNRGYLHVHHEPGRWVVGHDVSKMLLLCTAHHGMRHRGLLRIEPVAGGFRFTFLFADGSPSVFVPLDRGVVVTPQTAFAGVGVTRLAGEAGRGCA